MSSRYATDTIGTYLSNEVEPILLRKRREKQVGGGRFAKEKRPDSVSCPAEVLSNPHSPGSNVCKSNRIGLSATVPLFR